MLIGNREKRAEKERDHLSNGDLARIESSRERLLRNGFSTNYGGGFLLIPYYLQIGLTERVLALGLEKEEGIPTLSSVLGLINISIFEEGKISGINGLKDKGFPVLCGLGKLPDPSFFYRFMQGVKTRRAEEFIVECSKKFVETGLI